MSIRAKLLVLLGALIALFAGGLLLLPMLSRRQFHAVTQNRWQERSEALNRVLAHWSEPVDTFVTDTTCLDALARALDQNQPARAEELFPQGTLASFRVHLLWIYRPNGTSFMLRNNLYAPEFAELPVAVGPVLEDLARRRLTHFYAPTERGMMEIRGATIHPSRDTGRSGPPHGYLLAGRLWTTEDVKEMSLFTGNKLSIEPLPPSAGGASKPKVSPKFELAAEDAKDGVVVIRRQLPAWDGTAIATLYARNESPVMKEFHLWTERVFVWLVAFSCIVYLLLIFALHRWVIRPIRAISQSLRTENPALLEPWRNDTGDVGKLGKVVRTFFQQREALVNEMHDRREVEKNLQDREEELRHALKLEAIGRLAGGVAHDFNNLLTVIIGYATMLPRSQNAGPLAQGGEIILQAAQKAAALTQQLLAFSRKQLLHPRVIDLNALVQELQRLLHRTLGEHVELHVNATADPGRVRADVTQLEQVIVNLAINARDAMPRGGVLTITTTDAFIPEAIEGDEAAPEVVQGGVVIPPGRYVVLTVEDTGTGMDKETQDRIFEPFFTTKSAGRGTGLGLATVYGIIRQSGGIITVESQEGVGTRFSVFLPQETAPVDPPPPPQPIPHKTTRRESILVVDDDQSVRELMCRVLESHDFVVTCAADCNEALQIGLDANRSIDLLITDVVMPVFTGPELATRIRHMRPNLPVLMVSGYAHEAMGGLARLEPFATSLDKPFTPQELITRVFALLRDQKGDDSNPNTRAATIHPQPAALV